MATVTNDMIFFVLIFAMNYLVLWRKDKYRRLIADIFYIIIGITAYLIQTLSMPWGILICVISIIDMLYTLWSINRW